MSLIDKPISDVVIASDKIPKIINNSDFFNLMDHLPKATIQSTKKDNPEFYLILTPNENELKDKTYINFFIDNNIENTEQYKFYEYISAGAYNQVHVVKNIKTGNKYAYRHCIDVIENEKEYVNNYLEHFIHWKLKDEPNILKPYRIFYNKTTKLVGGLFELMDGTLGDILVNSSIITSIKIEVWIDCLKKLIPILQNLQEKYKFVHNDFKTNNVFFKFKTNKRHTSSFSKLNKSTALALSIVDASDLEWYIGDFDFTRVIIDNKVIYGNYVYSKEQSKKYNPRFDLFIFANSTFINLNNIIAKEILWSKIKIEPCTHETFTKTYKKKYEEISEIFEPKNFLNLLKDL